MNPRLLKEVKSVQTLLGLVILQGVLSGILIIAQASVLALIVSRVFIGHQTLASVQHLLWVLLAIIVARAVLTWLGETGSLTLATRVQSSLRMRLTQRLLNAGPLYVHAQKTGELVNTLIQGIEDLEPYLARYVPQIAITALVPTIILVEAFSRDWITGLILLITVPLIPFFMILIGRQAESSTKRQWETLSRLSAHFLDVLQGLTTLKLLGQSAGQARGIERASDEFRRATMASLRIAFVSALVLELLASLSMAMVAVAIGLRVIPGRMPFETAFFLLVLVPDFYLPWRMLGTRFHDGLNGMEAAKRIFEILDAPELAKAGGTMRPAAVDAQPIVLNRVGFQYPGRSEPALQGVSAVVKPGERVAVVGPSGAGKSTLLALLMGFAVPTSGTIALGDTPFTSLDLAWWRQHVMYLTQNPYIFAGTVDDNLRMARWDATDAEIRRAAERAGAWEYIAALPQGLQTVLGEGGTGLSGGQKQRLALARAYLKDAPVIFMDEPTANLDPETEAELWRHLEALLTGRTAVVVAHRLSTARRMDVVWAMNHGQLEQVGAPRELERVPGLYRELIQAYAPLPEEGHYASVHRAAETL
ncbi:thiol reductant ABC exporter subunit CydD [Sulfobacillus sp. hq2]|uniref:thiol reductant ABC exporter subunit CydD n=1 Tax=Sulfobacillus sp. hq2 TaxID=2039167 RepID=UPI000CD1DCC8|nr:thiol reductant ABC exporter subunit CydD [Sulfobacillus sp. hq2]POB11677.1 thiol reductant ABC exporter subunit CydD [Sulfobacillus sp. hq2]